MPLIPGYVKNSERLAIWDGAWWSYADLAERVSRVVQLLDGRGLAFCFCRVDGETIVNYLACLKAGWPVALLDGATATVAKLELIQRYSPEVIFADGDTSWMPAEYTASGPGLSQRRNPVDGELHPDLAVMLSTSGTTGSPRFVRLSLRNVEANAASIIEALGISAGERAIASLPFHYSYGLSVLNTHLMAGASLVTTREAIVSKKFWTTFQALDCTSFAGVPYSYQILDRLMDGLDAPSLLTMTQAGGKLNPELIARFHERMQRRNGRFFVMYGQTEATARIAILPSTDLPRKLGSAGRAIPGGSFAIKTADGESTAQPGVEGELVYTGPNVMMGYATCREELAQGDTLGGVLATGDLCKLDEEGYLFVNGRMKRDAKVFGLRLNLDEVEAMLKQHGPTAAVSRAGRLVVYCEYGDTHFLGDLRHQLASRLNLSFHAIEFHRLERLPLSPSGKIDYASLVSP